MLSGEVYQRNVTKVCLHSFMTGLRPFLPILFVFLKGLDYSYLQIGSLFSVMAFTSLIFEIPAGTFTDKFGAKYSMMLSSLMLGTAFLLVGLISNYNYMLLTFALWGASKSFYSGSDTTLIIESLKQANKLQKTSKYLSKKWASFYYGLAGGGLLCPFFLTYFEQRHAFFFSAGLYGLSLILLATVKQPPLDKSEGSEIHHIQTPIQYLKFLNNGKNYLLRHRTVKYLIIFNVMFAVASMIFFQYLQIMLQEGGVLKVNFGYYYAAFTALAAISSQQSHRLESSLGEKLTIYFLLSLTIVSLFGVKFFPLFPLALVPILVMQIQAGIFIPVMSSYLNLHIESHHRATLNSMKSFAGGLMMAVCSPIVGYVADKYDFRTALLFLGIFFILITLGPALKVSERISRAKA